VANLSESGTKANGVIRTELPTDPKDLTVELLNAVIGEQTPEIALAGFAQGKRSQILLAEQTEALEAALWTAVRIFREKSVLGRQLAARERDKGNDAVADRFEEQAAQSQQYGSLIVRHVLHVDPSAAGPQEADSVQDSTE
jgi:hypothetical protein